MGFSDVDDSEHMWKTWQKNVFAPTEFPSVGRLKRGNPVGADAYGHHDSYPLKYAMYELAHISGDETGKHAPLDIFRSGKADPSFHARLRELCVAFFQLIRKKVDHHCHVKNLAYSTLVLTMPTQWGGEANKPVHDAYESIIRTVWSRDIFSGPIHFVFEIEGLAHALMHEAAEVMEQYDQILFMDCGGHSFVSFLGSPRVWNFGRAATDGPIVVLSFRAQVGRCA
jgi:hypothetical protein